MQIAHSPSAYTLLTFDNMSQTHRNGTTNMTDSDSCTDVVILVLGPVGAGKSTFINDASNSRFHVSGGVKRCTDRSQPSFPFRVDGRIVTLVEIPAFAGVGDRDSDTLTGLCEYLVEQHSEPTQTIQGVIYLHSMTENKVFAESTHNFNIYRALCGQAALTNSAIATTKWNLPSPILEWEHEKELKEAFFKPAIEKGAGFVRYANNTASAHNIIRELLARAPEPLLLQQELCVERKKVYETRIGGVISDNLKRLREQYMKHSAELRSATNETEHEQGTVTNSELQEELEDLKTKIRAVDDEETKLRSIRLSSWPSSIAASAEAAVGQKRPAPTVQNSARCAPASGFWAWLKRTCLCGGSHHD